MTSNCPPSPSARAGFAFDGITAGRSNYPIPLRQEGVCTYLTVTMDHLSDLDWLTAAAPIMGDDDRDADNADSGVGVATKTRDETKKPSLYKVLLLNDDYTPMEFVVMVLQRFFRMDIEQATRVMLHVHQRGVGVCGVFTLEVAETKVSQVMDCARAHQHPLQCAVEKA
jgi:ATP-dependent Clp protease adaptor protein ClpS